MSAFDADHSDSEIADDMEWKIIPRVKRRTRGPGGIGFFFRGSESEVVVLNVALLKAHFNMSLRDAAKALGICATAIKKVCRKLGIKEWPFRKIQAVERKLSLLSSERNLKKHADNEDMAVDDQDTLQAKMGKLRNCREMLLEGKDCDLTSILHDTKEFSGDDDSKISEDSKVATSPKQQPSAKTSPISPPSVKRKAQPGNFNTMSMANISWRKRTNACAGGLPPRQLPDSQHFSRPYACPPNANADSFTSQAAICPTPAHVRSFLKSAVAAFPSNPFFERGVDCRHGLAQPQPALDLDQRQFHPNTPHPSAIRTACTPQAMPSVDACGPVNVDVIDCGGGGGGGGGFFGRIAMAQDGCAWPSKWVDELTDRLPPRQRAGGCFPGGAEAVLGPFLVDGSIPLFGQAARQLWGQGSESTASSHDTSPPLSPPCDEGADADAAAAAAGLAAPGEAAGGPPDSWDRAGPGPEQDSGLGGADWEGVPMCGSYPELTEGGGASLPMAGPGAAPALSDPFHSDWIFW